MSAALVAAINRHGKATIHRIDCGIYTVPRVPHVPEWHLPGDRPCGKCLPDGLPYATKESK